MLYREYWSRIHVLYWLNPTIEAGSYLDHCLIHVFHETFLGNTQTCNFQMITQISYLRLQFLYALVQGFSKPFWMLWSSSEKHCSVCLFWRVTLSCHQNQSTDKHKEVWREGLWRFEDEDPECSREFELATPPLLRHMLTMLPLLPSDPDQASSHRNSNEFCFFIVIQESHLPVVLWTGRLYHRWFMTFGPWPADYLQPLIIFNSILKMTSPMTYMELRV